MALLYHASGGGCEGWGPRRAGRASFPVAQETRGGK